MRRFSTNLLPLLWRRAFLGLVIPGLFCGCGASEHFTGRWRTIPDQQEEITPLSPGECSGDDPCDRVRGLELLLGHYGSEVAGTVRPYTNPFYSPLQDCPCLYITSLLATSDQIRFVLDPADCPALEGAGEIQIDLERIGDNEVRGTLKQFGANNAVVVEVPLVLERPTNGDENVLVDERGCDLPDDAGTE
jgi:hypothetical protein